MSAPFFVAFVTFVVKLIMAQHSMVNLVTNDRMDALRLCHRSCQRRAFVEGIDIEGDAERGDS